MSQERRCNSAHSFSCDNPLVFRSFLRFSPMLQSRLNFCSIFTPHLNFQFLTSIGCNFLLFYGMLTENIDLYTGQKVKREKDHEGNTG